MEKLKEIEFALPIQVNSKLSLNRIYGGIHWGVRRKQSQKVHEIVRLSMKSQNIPKILFEKPVNINFK